MDTYNIYYRKEYDVYIGEKKQYFNETGKIAVQAKNKTEAKEQFYGMFDKRADVLCCQMDVSVTIEDIVEQKENAPFFSETTKQNILKDFMKKG